MGGKFDEFFTQDELDRQNNTGKYERTPGYYVNANLRELANAFTGDPRRLRGAYNRLTQTGDLSDLVVAATPGSLSGLYSLADTAQRAVQDLVTANTPGSDMIDGKPADRTAWRLPGAEAAESMYNDSRDAANEFFEVEEIEGTGDFAAGVLPTLLAPGPKFDKAKTLLGKTGNLAAALTVPFSQSKFGSWQHLAEATVPIALSEGASAIADLPKDVYDSALRDEEPTPGAAAPQPVDPNEFFDPDDISDQPGADSAEAWHRTREAQVAAGTALALVAARLATNRGRLGILRGKHVPDPDQISGEQGFTNPLSAGTHAAKGVLDKNAPMAATIKHVGGTTEDVKNMEANAAAMANPVSQANIGTTALQFGIFPGMARKAQSLGRIMSAVAKLGDVDADLYGRAMSALDMVSRLRPGQILTGADGQTWDAGRLNAIVHQARQNPRIANLMNKTRTWYDDMREVLQRNGIIDAAEAARWAATHPHFIHTQIAFKNEDGLLKQFLTAIGTENKGPIPDSAVIRSLTERSYDPQGGVLPGQGENILKTMEKYGQSVVRAVMENNNKRFFFHEVERLSGGTGGGVVKRVQSAGKNTISFFENGKQVHYRVDDSALYDTLLFQPVLTVPVLNGARSLVHFWATGAGNPLFVWNAAMFDTLLSPFMRMNGDALGPLDEILRRATGGKFDLSNSIGIDPSFIANWPVGSTRFLYGAFMKEMGDRLGSSIDANGTFAKSVSALGIPPQQLLQIIDDAYQRSTHFLWNSLGGGANAATLATPEALLASISQTAPHVVGYLQRQDSPATNPLQWMRRKQAGITANTGWRAYTALMNSLHSGVKFQQFAANTAVRSANPMSRAARLKDIRAANSARELTVNTARTGDNKAYRTYASSALWGNVGVQSLYQLSRAIKDHPYRFATMTSAAGLATVGWLHQMFGADPEAAQYYYQSMTPTQRVQQGIPIYKDERGDFQFLPIDPNMRPLVAVMTEMYGAIAGHTAERPRSEEELSAFAQAMNTVFGTAITESQDDEIGAGFTTGLVNALPGADIPIVNLGMKQAGMTPQNDMVSWLAQRGQMYTPEKDSMISPNEERSVGAVLPKFIENVLTETIGTVGRRMVDSVNTFGRVIKSDATPLTAADAAYTQWQQSWRDADRGKPIQSLWTAHTNDKKIDTYNEVARRNRMSMEGIDSIIKWGEKGLKGANATDAASPMGLDGTSIELNKQKIAPLIIAVGEFKKSLQPIQESITDARTKLEDIERSPLLALRPDEQRQKANELRMVILEQQDAIYSQVQRFEDSFSRNLGMPVRLHDFDPADWTDENAIQQPQPLPPQQ